VARAGNLLTALTVVAVLLLTLAPALATSAQTSSSGDFNVVNLLNGINVPVVFQGVYSCNASTSSWPTYYGPSKASQYWSAGGISSDQPVLELTPAQGGDCRGNVLAGILPWQQRYSDADRHLLQRLVTCCRRLCLLPLHGANPMGR